MTVLGIDPGTAACGFGVVARSGNRLVALEFGWWATPAGDEPALRLKRIHDEVAALIESQPEEVAQTLRSWLADRRS